MSSAIINQLAQLIINHGHKFIATQTINDKVFLRVASLTSANKYDIETIPADLQSVKNRLGY